ncbi:rhodanese-like domain-containing protein [Listeria floridensis FSL S10-1187]|uniref:Rhodanese-like domain-containing protein n=1 Tax=Listeria floridensis FSL S10-1187 TaxID=1265817 RepID=A0ABN0RI90_9LIST|nr:rhodanese-like domain-containing protein [Listeria floridensis]EUJ33651.1 rhodanese-like domain-containing protein [Listeria floridensis FSL S10-1187]
MYLSTTTAELRQELDQYQILDVRDAEDFANGHIQGAVNIPITELAEAYPKLDQTASYAIICYAGGRSEQASRFLGDKGYQVTNVMGGMGAWQGEIVN